MRPSLRFLGIVVIVLATAAPAAAILDGDPDTAHPYVGILVTDIDGQRVPVCSGFLVNSTTFVTAAHCIDDLGDLPALVSFDQHFTPGSAVVTGTAVPNPGFGSPGADTHDLALIVLDTPVTNRGYAQLPAAGRLASADKKDAAHDRRLRRERLRQGRRQARAGLPARPQRRRLPHLEGRQDRLQPPHAGRHLLR